MSHISKTMLFVGCLSSCFLLHLATAADSPSTAVIVKRISNDLEILASDEYEGRGVGTEGLGKAADYVRDQFQQAGLDVTQVDGKLFRPFHLPNGAELGEHNSLVLTGPDGERFELNQGEDFEICSFGGSGKN